jgi:hypothetical protein
MVKLNFGTLTKRKNALSLALRSMDKRLLALNSNLEL